MGFKTWLRKIFWFITGGMGKYSILTHGQDVPLEDINIIRTTARHAKAIHALDKECFSDPWSFSSLKHDINLKHSVCFVAVSGSIILGHIIMQQIIDEGHIHNIAVSKYVRRQGIGRGLLEAAISESGILGIKSLTLEVRSQNHTAISLYEKLGFKTCGRRKNYYRKPVDDALVMKKEDL